MLCEAFAGAVGDDVCPEQFARAGEQCFRLGVVCVEEAGVVQVFVDPCLQVFELTKVDDEAIRIGLAAGEGQGDAPIVPVDEGAVALVQVLAVGEWNVAVGFFTSEHGDWKVGRWESGKVGRWESGKVSFNACVWMRAA